MSEPTVVMRIPDSLYESIKPVAQLKGVTVGGALAEAWDQYVATHRAELVALFERAADDLRGFDDPA